MSTTDLMQPLRAEHAHLLARVEDLRALGHELPHLSPSVRGSRLAPVLEFLYGTLLPHAQAEERVFYPAVAELLGDPRAIDPMLHDHKLIKEYTAALASADHADAERLVELVFGVYALVLSHFRKEEELYVPLLEGHPVQAAQVTAALAHAR